MYQISPKDLYEDEIIKNHLLLTDKENYNTWKHLSTVNQASNAIGRREDFIYEELQDEFNKISRAITIANHQGNIKLVIDDDKVFCRNNKCKDTYSLKYTTHVNDNRKAMSATAVQQHALCFLLVSNGSNKESLPIPALNPFYEGFSETVVVATQICGM